MSNRVIEYRAFSSALTKNAEAKKIGGYAALYSVRSSYIGFYEVIEPGAFDNAISKSDIRCLFNHDPNLILGRTGAGTLAVSVDNKGLYYEVVLPDTSVGENVYNAVSRGDVTQSSFGFIVGKDRWYEEIVDGKKAILRSIITIEELFDVSPVTYPAYHETSVNTRAAEINKFIIHSENHLETDRLRIRKDYLKKIQRYV
ncbi:MAG: HK97 family phage prohead protease [candidate division WOR-3 bacterium]